MVELVEVVVPQRANHGFLQQIVGVGLDRADDGREPPQRGVELGEDP